MTPDAIPPGADGGSAERQRRLKRRLGSTFVLVGLLLVAANLRASITSVGPVIDRIQQDLALTSAAAAALTSLPLIAFALVSPIAARIANQLGLERVLGLSVGLLAVGILVRSAEPTWLIWIGTAILGVAIAVLNVVLPALVKRDFPTKIGLVTGAYTAVQSGFAAIAAGVAVPVANASEYGWRAAIGIWSALALLALLVFAPQMTRRTVVLAPQSYPLVTKVSPWRRSIAWQVTIFMGLQSLAFYVLTAWLAPIELSAGLSAATAGVHQALMNVGSLVGSLVCSVLIHRLRDHRPIALGTGLSMATAFAGILLAPEGTAVWASLAGVSSGMSLVLSLSFFGLRTRHHLTAASLSAMAQCIGYVIAALGPLTIGAIHDVTGSWTSPLLLLIGIALVQSAVGVLAARNRFLD